MTTNPIAIPDAAIEAGNGAFDVALSDYHLLGYGAIKQRLIVEDILRAAAPHLVGELVEALRLIRDGSYDVTGTVIWAERPEDRKTPEDIAREALRALEAPSE